MTVADPATRAGRPAETSALAALIAVLAVFLYVVPRATVIVLPAIALVLIAMAVRKPGFTWRALPHAALPALPLLGIALISTLWALEPMTSLGRGLRLAGEIAMATVLLALVPIRPGPALGRAIGFAAGGLIAASLFSFIDVKLEGALSAWARRDGAAIGLAYSRSGALLAMAALPLAAALWRTGRRGLAGATLAASLAVPTVGSSTASLAVALGLLAALGVLAAPRLRWLVLGLQILIVLALPLALPIGVDARVCDLLGSRSSAMHRIAIWNFAHEQWRERPLLGWGLESSRDLGAKRRVTYMAGCNVPAATEAATEEALPLHPHNFAIQIWLELGVLGAIAMAWLIGHLTLRAWRTAPGRFGYATTTGFAVAAFTIASSSYGLWQSWWVAALALGAALGLLCSRVATQKGQG